MINSALSSDGFMQGRVHPRKKGKEACKPLPFPSGDNSFVKI